MTQKHIMFRTIDDAIDNNMPTKIAVNTKGESTFYIEILMYHGQLRDTVGIFSVRENGVHSVLLAQVESVSVFPEQTLVFIEHFTRVLYEEIMEIAQETDYAPQQ